MCDMVHTGVSEKQVLTMTRKSACVPVKTGMSIGTLTEYGLLRRTPR